MINFYFRIAAIILVLFSMVGVVQAQAPATGIRVLVYGIHYGGNIVYNYKVINSGNRTVRSFIIGSEQSNVRPDP